MVLDLRRIRITLVVAIMASKTIRFDVFKRDAFTCQYCGRKPPKIVLEIDHIYPKSKGGKDDINNYITACYDCNRGKTNKLLTTVPATITRNLKKLKEKRLQIEEYHKYVQSLSRQKEKDIEAVNREFIKCSHEKYELSNNFKNDAVRTFVTRLPPIKVIEAMKMACSRLPYNDVRVLKYFCGICWQWIKNPEMRDW